MDCEESDNVAECETKSSNDEIMTGRIEEDQPRPQRFAAQRAKTFFLTEQTSVLFYKEQSDIKKAVRRSLIEARRAANKAIKNESNGCAKLVNGDYRVNRVEPKDDDVDLNGHGAEIGDDEQLKSVCQSVIDSASKSKKPKIPAQRKFASSSLNNTPVSSPIKCESKSLNTVAELFQRHRPSTEDFLTFLCFRNTEVLPIHLDFQALNGHLIENELEEESLSKQTDIIKGNNDKSNISMLTKSIQHDSVDATKSVNKQQKEIKDLNELKKNGPVIKSITSSSKCSAEQSESKEVKRDSNENTRVLRYNRSITLISPEAKKDSNNASLNLSSGNSSDNNKRAKSPIGIRPHKRKAKPDALIDYHYVIEGEDSDNELISGKKCTLEQAKEDFLYKNRTPSKCETKDSSNSAKSSVQLSKKKLDLNKASSSKKLNSKSKTKDSEKETIELSKKEKGKKNDCKDKGENKKRFYVKTELKKSGNEKIKSKTCSETSSKTNKKKTASEKRVTRSMRSSSITESPMDAKQRESLIRQQIMAIEQRHKTMRRTSSDKHDHDSDDSSSESESTSSDEEIPSPQPTKAPPISIPRLTRSIQLIKKLRARAIKERLTEVKNKIKTDHKAKLLKKEMATNASVLKKSVKSFESVKRPSSPIGIRPHKRKAKPDAPLIDYHYIIDDDDDSDVSIVKVKKSSSNVTKSSTRNISAKNEIERQDSYNGLKDASSQTHSDFVS